MPRLTSKSDPRRLLPSPRLVSRNVHEPAATKGHNLPELTNLLQVWGQFLDHDITGTPAFKGGHTSSFSVSSICLLICLCVYFPSIIIIMIISFFFFFLLSFFCFFFILAIFFACLILSLFYFPFCPRYRIDQRMDHKGRFVCLFYFFAFDFM